MNKRNLISMSVRLKQFCTGCGADFYTMIDLSPREFDTDGQDREHGEHLVRTFIYAKKQLEYAPCPKCEKSSDFIWCDTLDRFRENKK